MIFHINYIREKSAHYFWFVSFSRDRIASLFACSKQAVELFNRSLLGPLALRSQLYHVHTNSENDFLPSVMSHLTVNLLSMETNMWVHLKHLKNTESFKVRPTLLGCISERKSAGFTWRQRLKIHSQANDDGNYIFSIPANL